MDKFDLLLNILTVFFLAFGIFFMMVGAVGLVRLPDVYHRMHAATKGVTLGISGMMIAAAFAASNAGIVPPYQIIATVTVVIMFQFVANPVGAHMLAKAAHLDGAPTWKGTKGDELREDAGVAGSE